METLPQDEDLFPLCVCVLCCGRVMLWPPTKQHLWCLHALSFLVLGALAAAISPGIALGCL